MGIGRWSRHELVFHVARFNVVEKWLNANETREGGGSGDVLTSLGVL